jgi:hypothetical protein
MERFHIGERMKDSVFSPEAINEIVEKIKKDKTGRMSSIMNKIMDVSERAGRYGFDLRELSIIATTGWYLSQNPELKEFFDQLINMPPPPAGDDDIYN